MRKTIILASMTTGLAISAIVADLVRAFGAEVSESAATYTQAVKIWLAI